MKRSYAYALIVFATALLGSLVWLHFQLVDQALAEAYEFERETVQLAIEVGEERVERLIWDIEGKLEDPSKAKFKPILPVIASASEGYKGISNSFQTLGYDRSGRPLPKSAQANMLRKLAKDISLEVVTLRKTYFNMLDEHGAEMDLMSEEIEKAKQRAKNYVKERGGSTQRNLRPGNFFQQRDMLVLAYLLVHEKILYDIVNIAGGKVISCRFGPRQFPFIAEPFENPRVGETINTHLGIGTYDEELDTRYLRVVVNGDTLRANDKFGGMQYSFTPTQRGDQALEMEMLYENPLTGQVLRRMHYYKYFVR